VREPERASQSSEDGGREREREREREGERDPARDKRREEQAVGRVPAAIAENSRELGR